MTTVSGRFWVACDSEIVSFKGHLATTAELDRVVAALNAYRPVLLANAGHKGVDLGRLPDKELDAWLAGADKDQPA